MAESMAWNLAWVSASSASRIAVGDDAAAGDEARRARSVDSSAQRMRDRPRAVAARVDPADRAAVQAALEALDRRRSARSPSSRG